jgi:peroxin-5
MELPSPQASGAPGTARVTGGHWSKEFMEFQAQNVGQLLPQEQELFRQTFERAQMLAQKGDWVQEFNGQGGNPAELEKQQVAWEAEFQNALQATAEEFNALSVESSSGTTHQDWSQEFVNIQKSLDVQSGIHDEHSGEEQEWMDKFNAIWKGQEDREDPWAQEFQNKYPEDFPIDVTQLDPTKAPLVDYLFEQENPFLDHPDPLQEGLRILKEHGPLSDAALAFEAAAQKNPNSSEAWMHLGITQAENEKELPAIAALQRSVHEDPANIQALMVDIHTSFILKIS